MSVTTFYTLCHPITVSPDTCSVPYFKWYPNISSFIELSTKNSTHGRHFIQHAGNRICRNNYSALLWRHNGRDSVSNHQPHHCLLNRLFVRRSKKTSKLRVTGLCAGNSPVTGEFPAQMPSNGENVSIWWRHHGIFMLWPPRGLQGSI